MDPWTPHDVIAPCPSSRPATGTQARTAAAPAPPPGKKVLSKRELKILQLFGVSRDLTATSTAAAREIEQPPIQRQRRKRRGALTARWTDLPNEVKEKIAQQLSMTDLHAACLGGLSLPSTRDGNTLPTGATRAHTANNAHNTEKERDEERDNNVLRRVFTSRVSSLEPLFRRWIARSRGGITRSRRLVTTPTAFSTQVALLSLGGDVDPSILSGAHEITSLRELNLSTPKYDANSLPACVRQLPLSLGLCAQLRVLSLRRAAFALFPACILSLANLQRLDVSRSQALTCLPDDLGTACARLHTLDITACPRLTLLPPSVLATLEQNAAQYAAVMKTRKRRPGGDAVSRVGRRMRKEGASGKGVAEDVPPLRLSVQPFGREYLVNAVDEMRFPHVMAGLRRLRGFDAADAAAPAPVPAPAPVGAPAPVPTAVGAAVGVE